MNSKIGCLMVAVAGLMLARPAIAQEKAAGEPFVVNNKLAKDGKKLFTDKGCVACHTVGKGVLVGPDLAGVFSRRTPEWIQAWLHDPPKVMESDTYAKALLAKYKIAMPNLALSDKEILSLMNYLASSTKK